MSAKELLESLNKYRGFWSESEDGCPPGITRIVKSAEDFENGKISYDDYMENLVGDRE